MISDAISAGLETELFATWTTYFEVQIDREMRILEFRRAKHNGLYDVPRNLFRFTGTLDHHPKKLIQALLSLGPGSTDKEWVEAATLIGPLTLIHPMHHAVFEPVLTESLDVWLEQASTLRTLWKRLEGPRPAKSMLPPAHYASDVGQLLNEIFVHHPEAKLQVLLNPRSLQVEIAVPQAIQALCLMSVTLSRQGDRAFPRQCARRTCTKMGFFKGVQRYCSTECQVVDKSARYRQRHQGKKAVGKKRVTSSRPSRTKKGAA